MKVNVGKENILLFCLVLYCLNSCNINFKSLRIVINRFLKVIDLRERVEVCMKVNKFVFFGIFLLGVWGL